MKLDVLYEDNHVIAVNKPAGMLVQEGDERREWNDSMCLMDEVKTYLKEKYQKPGNVFLGLIHRLDRNVSGIVLFAKTSKGASRLSEQFRLHTTTKIYHAWVEGVPKPASGTLVHYLIKDEGKNKTKVFAREVPQSQYAELSYTTVQQQVVHSKEYALIKVELKTGRSHQIRAQFAYIGCPIVGDVKYGAHGALPDQSIRLTATELHFETATGGEKRVISLPVPEF